MTLDRTERIEQLLGHADWITRLSRVLVRDGATADDVAQDAWLDALRAPVASVADPRRWLAAIVRRRAGKARRSEERRRRREQAAAAHEALPSADELTARVAMQRELTEAVLALDEPYRSTIVLRFFENLDSGAIAARTGAPRNTVRSRLQRGLQQLRERLDRDGGRERWLPAVLVLGKRTLATEAAATGGLVTGIALLTTMKKTMFVAAAVAAALTITVALASGPDAPSAPSPANAKVAVATAPGAAASADGVAAERTSVAPPIANAARDVAAPPRGLRLVDVEGRPLASVRMRAESEFAVHWQGGDRGWINGGGEGLNIDAATEAKLRADSAFAREFFAQFAHPDEWAATVLGAPLPAREATTDFDGSFAFARELQVADEDVTVADPAFVLLAAGARDRAPWIAGPAVEVTGVVRSAVDGQPLAHANVESMAPLRDGVQRAAGQRETNSERDGSFYLRRAFAGGMLRASREGYESAVVPVGTGGAQRVDVVLRPRATQQQLAVDGIVVAPSGVPIAGASVWYGRQSSKTGSDGRFAFAVDEAKPLHALTVVATGYPLLQRDGLGAQLRSDPAAGRDLVLMLRGKPLQIRGLVLGGDGRPLAGARVGLVDPTLLDITFEGVEARVGGFAGGVTSGADGAFAIGGLCEREYRLAAVDPATGLVVWSAPIAAGAEGVVLPLPTDARRAVRGQVMRGDKPVAGATIAIEYCVHVTKGGGNQFDAIAPVACDAAGRFELSLLPRQRAWLAVRVGGKLQAMLPVEACGDGELRIDLQGPRWLQLVAGAQPAPRTIAFERADGRVVAAQRGGQPAVIAIDGACAPLELPTDAVAVVLDRGRATETRLELTDDLGMNLRVR